MHEPLSHGPVRQYLADASGIGKCSDRHPEQFQLCGPNAQRAMLILDLDRTLQATYCDPRPRTAMRVKNISKNDESGGCVKLKLTRACTTLHGCSPPQQRLHQGDSEIET